MKRTAIEILHAARDNERPTSIDYIASLITSPTELRGDRAMGDDKAIIGGIGYIRDMPVTFIGIEKGKTIEERVCRNFGSVNPEGYRKALRLMENASKFNRPILCLVDTAGAGAGIAAEAHGQGFIISENIAKMFAIKSPIITIIIGEGGSGGALGLSVCDRLMMLENAVYSVISPEGCASILWKDASRVAEAASSLKITAGDMRKFGVAEEIILENFEDFEAMSENLKDLIHKEFTRLKALDTEDMLKYRYEKFRKIGALDKK